MSGLRDRVALVTGAGRGIGRSIAMAFAKEGARVAVTARTQKEIDEVVATIGADGGRAHAVIADLSKPDAPGTIVAEVERAFGPIEVLVNNAGVGSSSNPKPVVDFDDDFWRLSLEVNLTAPYALCKLVLPEMLEKRWGRIIAISSINGKIGSFHGAAYAATKHGLLGLTRTLAMEVADQGITVNAICPGPVNTVMNTKRIEYDADRRGVDFATQETSLTAIGRRLVPDEIAPLAVYLASDEAAAMTGQAINLCGGTLIA